MNLNDLNPFSKNETEDDLRKEALTKAMQVSELFFKSEINYLKFQKKILTLRLFYKNPSKYKDKIKQL